MGPFLKCAALAGVAASLSVLAAPAGAQQQSLNGNASLDASGRSSGVEFKGDHTLTVPAGQNIGASNDISIIAGGGATPQGTVLFQGSATVEGRIGGVLDEIPSGGSSRVFLASPSGRLNLIRITQETGSSSPPTVTFKTPLKPFVIGTTTIRDFIGLGGVGAQALRFETDGTALLEQPSGHQGATFYDIKNVTTTQNGQGTLTFKHNASINFRGDIGAPGRKLKSLVNDTALANSNVRILGNIYANTIRLDTTSRPNSEGALVLGNAFGVFVAPTIVATPSIRISRPTSTTRAPF